MDHKSWPWKKKSTEKNIVAPDKANLSLRRNDDEETLLSDKAELERELKVVNDKLSSALTDCRAQDEFAQKQTKIAQEAIAGWEKTETEARLLNQELEKALQQKAAGEERLVNLDAALKECMQQLRFVRDEQEKRIDDAVSKGSKEFGKARTLLEEKLADTGKQLSRLGSENTQLSMALMANEKATSHLKGQIARAEADFSALKTRLESVEKENASLRYEVRVLEKELEIRNEEREFSRRTADVAQKQHLESVKKIAKLDSECQRLRVLVRKRLPGPAALARMKNEVETLGKDHVKMRRRKSNPSLNGSVDLTSETAPDTPNRNINFLSEQLCIMEEENRTLKEALNKRSNELKLSRMTTAETEKYLPAAQELSVTSLSDMDSDVGCSESWASALISELEHFKNEKQIDPPSSISVGASDINLMDDFAEMEKLAVESTTKNPVEANESSKHTDATRTSNIGDSVSQEIHDDSLIRHSSNTDTGDNVSLPKNCEPNMLSYMGTSINKVIDIIEGISIPSTESTIPEILSSKCNGLLPYEDKAKEAAYMVRVFQWKTSELSAILQEFVQTCRDLSNGKVPIEKFAERLTQTLEWIVNHCFSLQDVSSMKDAIKNQFDWDDSRSENGMELGVMNPIFEFDKLQTGRGNSLYSSLGRMSSLPEEVVLTSVDDEGQTSKDEIPEEGSTKEDLERKLQAETLRSESLMVQLQESEKTIKSLQEEVENLRQSKELIEDQIEKEKMAKEDLEIQLNTVKLELNEACRKPCCLEKELEDKSNSYMKLDSKCRMLQLQQESTKELELSENAREDPEEKLLQSDREITAASEKLAECQETIFNLGRQLKALASPGDGALFDKVISMTSETRSVTMTTPKKIFGRRSSLLDKMLAEDIEIGSPTTKEVIVDAKKNTSGHGSVEQTEKSAFANVSSQSGFEAVTGSVAIVPSKKKIGLGLWKKLLRKGKKNSSTKKLHI